MKNILKKNANGFALPLALPPAPKRPLIELGPEIDGPEAWPDC